MVALKPISNQPGDFIPSAGIYSSPGVVMGQNEDGTISVDTNPESIREFHKYSITNGLNIEDKIAFNAIIDDVMTHDDDDRINILQARIRDIQNDPSHHANLLNKLKSEQAELIRSAGRLPTIYTVKPSELR